MALTPRLSYIPKARKMKLLVVGEFLSQKDDDLGGPFRDGNGKAFKAMMRQAGIEPREVQFTNVFLKTSPNNTMSGFCGPKAKGVKHLKPVAKGKYLLPEHMAEVELLWRKVNEFKPNLVLAVGDLAMWALTSENNIESARGRISKGHAGIPGRKVLPIYSGRQMMFDYTQRPIVLADMHKAAREMEFPELRRPQRFIHIQPSIEDIEDFIQTYVKDCVKLDVDIETKGTLITCVGFAPTPDRALVIPFYDDEQSDGNYWRTHREEYLAWQAVARMLRMGKAVGGQNFQYDMQYLWQLMGIPCPTFTDDTMIMHHSLQPEMRKGLGFLASIYTDEMPWKFMHKIKASDKTAKDGDDD